MQVATEEQLLGGQQQRRRACMPVTVAVTISRYNAIIQLFYRETWHDRNTRTMGSIY